MTSRTCSLQNQAKVASTITQTTVAIICRGLWLLEDFCSTSLFIAADSKNQEKPIQRPEAATVNQMAIEVSAISFSTLGLMASWGALSSGRRTK